MRLLSLAIAVAVALAVLAAPACAADQRPVFEPNWESLNARESPEWFADAKFGIFIHWGVFSVPSVCDTSTYSEWYYWWLKTNSHGGLVRKFHEKNYGKDFKYQDFAPMFKAELWQPDDWAKLFKRAGAKYVVLVSKHHDGFALWPSKQASQARGYKWNSVETGPKRDICGELSTAVRKQGLRMGFYFSFMEWLNPLYDKDKQRYVDEHMIPQLKDLVTRYKPDIIWPDGEWNHPDTVWRSPQTLAWLYNTVPNYDVFVVNDRWGKGLRGHSGDYYTTEYGHTPWANEGATDPGRPFEECRGIGHSFAFNRLEGLDFYLDRDELVQLLIDKVSRGGGLLLNLGPAADGRIPVIQQDRLAALGKWLKVHGESIYGTRKGLFKHLPFGRSTTRGNTAYLHVFDWPADGTLELAGLMTNVRKASLLHDTTRKPLKLTGNGTGSLGIDLAGYHPHAYASVIALECEGRPTVLNIVLPDAQGAATLHPNNCTKLAGGLRVEQTKLNNPGGLAGTIFGHNIGFWTNPKGTATWDVRLKPGTQYEVDIEWSCDPANAGGAYEVAIAGKKLTGKTAPHTGGWRTYKTTRLGRVQIARQGNAGADWTDVTVTIRGTKLIAGKALMNVRAITLTPVAGGK